MHIKEVLEYALKLKTDEVHFTKKYAQCFNGRLLLSIPFTDKALANTTVNLRLFQKIIVASDDKRTIRKTAKRIFVESTNFKGSVAYATDWEQRKKPSATNTYASVDFEVLHALLPFTTHDSDNLWAMSVNVADGYAYCTNNIVICRHPFHFPDFIIAKEILQLHYSLKTKLKNVSIGKNGILFEYDNNIWLTFPKIDEKAPSLGAVFNTMKKCTPLPPEAKQAILTSIALSTNDEIILKKETVVTDNSKFKKVNFKGDKCILSSEYLTDVLKLFNKCYFGKELSFFKNGKYEAIMAGRA